MSYVQTVLGPVSPDSLGRTMMHEHLLADGSVSGYYYQEPKDPLGREMASRPVSLETLWWVRYNFKDSLDNLVLDDEELAIRELRMFADAGGGTIVDLTTRGIGRDPAAIARISREAGVSVVMGTGFYVEDSHPPEASVPTRGVQELAEEMIGDIATGAEGTAVRAGIIGELGCSWPLRDGERKVLEAAGIAQQSTGVAINVHPGRAPEAIVEIRDILAEAGASLDKVVISHMDRCGYPLEARRDVLDSGCTLEYDVFGLEGYYPARTALMDGVLPTMPNDVGRILEIKELFEMGYGDQIVVSHDIGMKMMLAAYGGWGYGHILRNVIPLMEIYGLRAEDIDRMTISSPARLLAIDQDP